jgi:hypothetical protein
MSCVVALQTQSLGPGTIGASRITRQASAGKIGPEHFTRRASRAGSQPPQHRSRMRGSGDGVRYD